MILTKEEWKIYKKRNIERLLQAYIWNKKATNSKFYKLIAKIPCIHQAFCNILIKKFKLDFRLTRKASIPNIDFQITTKCTLQCEQCCSLMPFFSNKTHHEETFENFKRNLDNLLKNVHYIYKFQLIGGEPLLNKELARMVEYASKKRQIKYIITITNGTIIPDEKLLKAYKKYKHKNYIDISDYTCNQEIKNAKPDKVMQKFKEYGITAYMTNYEWYLRGCIKKENRTPEELERVYNSCWQINCPSYCDGELHICSRSVGIKRNIDNNLKDYIIVDEAHNISNVIIKNYVKKYINACDYCHTDMSIKIPRGIQSKQQTYAS